MSGPRRYTGVSPMPTHEAADILLVNWNGAFFLRHFLPLALELTNPAHRFSIWDNASVDESQALLLALARRQPRRVSVHFARTNQGHAFALERLLERTDRDLLVLLDCDATPLRAGWVETLAAGLRDGVAGHGIWFAHYLHPACLCTRRTTLVHLEADLHPDYPHRDVFQGFTHRAQGAGLELIRLADDGDYLFDGFGQTYGDHLIYHHWFGTRVNPAQGLEETPEGRTREGLARSQRALEAWLRERGLWRELPQPGRARAFWDRLVVWRRAE